ncbi:MAG: putative integral membrane protein (dedA homolog) [uncultured Campylobacterales bacterium]|uniref:Putative integral membrane protein (DedA homolog) n=1 Tax=uncultured Campylobacterales bacterium TaxID=352960 RepID=A0A6S6T6C0_9BACT|nr:MAG: putative integral membrane protein (dedA homolog) [uncultured Campylobacterales bacterium]
MMHEIADFIINFVGDIGYIGIVALMALESSFFPFPSEVVMIPAGYLSAKGEMNIYIVVFMGILGSLLGGLLNYFLAFHFGEKFLLKFGKYFFFKEKHLNKLKIFFSNHGEISTFNGRLIPGLRQYISFPAGLAKMNIYRFSFFTSLGAGIWMIVLVLLGYFLGGNEALIKENLKTISLITIGLVILLSIIYIMIKKRN